MFTEDRLNMFQIFKELPKHLPAILFIPNIGEFWTSLTFSLQKLFLELLDSLDITLPVFILATSLYDFKDLPKEVNIACNNKTY